MHSWQYNRWLVAGRGGAGRWWWWMGHRGQPPLSTRRRRRCCYKAQRALLVRGAHWGGLEMQQAAAALGGGAGASIQRNLGAGCSSGGRQGAQRTAGGRGLSSQTRRQCVAGRLRQAALGRQPRSVQTCRQCRERAHQQAGSSNGSSGGGSVCGFSPSTSVFCSASASSFLRPALTTCGAPSTCGRQKDRSRARQQGEA